MEQPIRTWYTIEWTNQPSCDRANEWYDWWINDGLGAENLQTASEMMETMIRAFPYRMWAVFTWKPGVSRKPRRLGGAKEAELYREKYGSEMPIGSALGSLVETFDRNIVE